MPAHDAMTPGFPDVCLPGPTAAPAPYSNMAMNAMAPQMSPEVLLTHAPALNMMSPLANLQSMLPDPHPSVMGGMAGFPGVMLGGGTPNLPASYTPPAGAGMIPSISSIMMSMLPSK